MSDLIKFEFQKLFSKRLFVVFLLFAILTNGYIYIGTEKISNNAIISDKEIYEEYINKYSRMNNNKALEVINEDLNKLSIYNNIISLDDERNNEEYKNYLKEQIDNNKEVVDNFKKSIYKDNPDYISKHITILQLIKDNITYINGYHDYLKEIKNNKDRMLEASIFYKKDTFSYNNIVKTAKDFELLENIELKLDKDEGIKSINILLLQM